MRHIFGLVEEVEGDNTKGEVYLPAAEHRNGLGCGAVELPAEKLIEAHANEIPSRPAALRNLVERQWTVYAHRIAGRGCRAAT